jgi:hypothetical protein
MENFEPYYDLTKATEIAKYVKHWIDEYRKTPEKKATVLEKLKVIFSEESEYRAKVLAGNEFIPVFKERVRKKRAENLKMFLMEINPERYGKVNYQGW